MRGTVYTTYPDGTSDRRVYTFNVATAEQFKARYAELPTAGKLLPGTVTDFGPIGVPWSKVH